MNTNQQLDLFRMGQPDEEAIRLLRSYEDFALKFDPRGYCVCTSEGKDSRVLGHLMRRAGVKHFYIHNITGIDPPELVYFQRRNFQAYSDMGYEVHDCMYDKSIWQLMREKKIPPLRHMRYCCACLKERKTPEQGNAMISTGVRRAESTRRAKQRAELEHDYTHLNPYDQEDGVEVETFRTCFDNPDWAKEGLWTINPIAEWPDHWVWDYSAEAHLEQCSLYGEGFDRLGCIGCPMARERGRRREFDRWPAFERLWRRAFDRLVETRESLGLVQRFSSGSEWFEWWMSDAAMEEPIDEDQLYLDGFYEEANHDDNKALERTAAIAYFEDAIRESDEILSECSPALQAELTEQKRHFVVALDALKREAAEPPNDPLTLDELRGMDGEPMYIKYIGTCEGFYDNETAPYYGQFEQHIQKYNGMLRACDLPLKYYGEMWLAYRRKPDGGGEQ